MPLTLCHRWREGAHFAVFSAVISEWGYCEAAGVGRQREKQLQGERTRQKQAQRGNRVAERERLYAYRHESVRVCSGAVCPRCLSLPLSLPERICLLVSQRGHGRHGSQSQTPGQDESENHGQGEDEKGESERHGKDEPVGRGRGMSAENDHAPGLQRKTKKEKKSYSSKTGRRTAKDGN